MAVLVQGLKLDGTPGPFQTFADAVELAKAGKTEEAKTKLRSILGTPNLETRIQLWVWSALRELGKQPNANLRKEILGVVIEVPMRGAYDTLAGYEDGSARYINFSGKAIFWDKPEASIKLLCERLIASTIPESSGAVLRKDTVLPKSGTQVTLLTRSGMYVIAEPATEHHVYRIGLDAWIDEASKRGRGKQIVIGSLSKPWHWKPQLAVKALSV
jgi:hypothetical protein